MQMRSSSPSPNTSIHTDVSSSETTLRIVCLVLKSLKEKTRAYDVPSQVSKDLQPQAKSQVTAARSLLGNTFVGDDQAVTSVQRRG